MFKEKASSEANTAKKKSWPRECAWPAPVGEYGGIHWDEDMIPLELDKDTEDLVEIKDYFDKLVEDGRLDDEYYLLPIDEDDQDEEEWEPEQGEEFWVDDHFDVDCWLDELSDCLNHIKIDVCENDPIVAISNTLGYYFVNENLLRQAFTRRAFQIEYGLSGCSEELEFLGDSVLSLVTTKELMAHFSEMDHSNTEAPLRTKLDEGALTRLKSTFVCKEHLAKRCEILGLDRFILYGTGEEASESAKEDVVEALIGAVAVDCHWDMEVLEDVIDRLVSIQVDEPDRYLKKSFYEILNGWHMHHFGFLPEYEIYMKSGRKTSNYRQYECVLKLCIPKNDKGIHTGKTIVETGETRSRARDAAAASAYRFILNQGLWMNLKDAGVIPDYDNAINQLQELYQKKYIEQPVYEFAQEAGRWICSCRVNDISSSGKGAGKTPAKKMAAYQAVVLLLKAAGCCQKEWYDRMRRIWVNNACGVIIEPETEAIEMIQKAGITYRAVSEVLMQIEPGKVITEKVLTEWIGKCYGIENMSINWKEFPYPHLRDTSIPFHRLLTSKGLIQECYKDALLAEGHEIVPTKTTNWRVLDYKETMVDVRELTVPEQP